MGAAELLKNLSLLSFALAGVFAAAAVFLFFKLDIRGVVRILSGSTMKKDMEAYRNRESELSSGSLCKTTKMKKKRKGEKKRKEKKSGNRLECQNRPIPLTNYKNQKESAEQAEKPLDFEDRTELLEEGTMLLNAEMKKAAAEHNK